LSSRKRKNQPARRGQPPARRAESGAGPARGGDLVYAERSYSGPLPEPADLQAYDMVEPGTARIIVQAFEEQGKHRRALEQAIVRGSEGRGNIGQWMAFTVLMTGVVGGCVVALAGEPAAGGAIAAAAFTSGAVSYVVGGRPPKQE
jgi:hypothetical protein